jgi:hypothetical protein
MRLKTLPVTPVKASDRFTTVMTEAGALPRWHFDYSGRKTYDPRPDVLVLGAYRHPNTGNRLVGGINLNYMTSGEHESLEKLLPKISRGRNLYERYNIGRSLNPLIFTTYYRTYNADAIDMIGKSQVYPQYGTYVTMPDQTTEFDPSEAPPPPQADDLEELDTAAPAELQPDVAVPAEPEMAPEVELDQDAIAAARAQEVQDEIADADPIEPPAEYEADIEPMEPEVMPDYDAEPAVEPEEDLVVREPEPVEIPVEDEDDDIEPIDDHDDERLEESIRYYSPSKGRYIVEQWTRFPYETLNSSPNG